jgi:hypothetical protein
MCSDSAHMIFIDCSEMLLISIKLRSGKHIAYSAESFGKLIPLLGGMNVLWSAWR